MAEKSRNELIEEIENYKSLIKSATTKIKALEAENHMLSAPSGDSIADKVADLSQTIAKQAGNILDTILSVN